MGWWTWQNEIVLADRGLDGCCKMESIRSVSKKKKKKSDMTLRRGGRESQMSLLRATRDGRLSHPSPAGPRQTDRDNGRWSSSPIQPTGSPPPLAASSLPPTAPLGKPGLWGPPDPPGHRSDPCAQQDWSEPAIRKRIIRTIVVKCCFIIFFKLQTVISYTHHTQ